MNNDIYNCIIKKLSEITTPISIQELAIIYLKEQLQLTENCVTYTTQLNSFRKKIALNINYINEKFNKENIDSPILICGNLNNYVKITPSFEILSISLKKNIEDPHIFANTIGRKLLEKSGCTDEHIFITPNSRDSGIDYWGKLRICEKVITHKECFLIIVGQVKKYEGSVPVQDIREFIGSIKTALNSNVINLNNIKI